MQLDNNPNTGEQLQLLVKGECWKASILETGEFSLISEAVFPEFEYTDMTLITSQDVQGRFPALWQTLQNYISDF